MSQLDKTDEQNAPSVSKRWKMVFMWLIAIIATLATIIIGAFVGNRSYIVVSILVIIYTMIPFFVQFEQRKPQARELVLLAVMVALAVASRAVFAFFPNFKPMAGIVMITGIALGASSGFLAGSLSVLVSNFIFGQGPWTPWQMLSIGLCGFVFGFLADKGIIKRNGWNWKQRIVISFGAFLFIVVIAGPILDTNSVFWMLSRVTKGGALAIYLSGIPFNAMHGIAVGLTVLLAGNPIIEKLGRIKVKYGLMQ